MQLQMQKNFFLNSILFQYFYTPRHTLIPSQNVPSPAETRDQFVDNFISILLPISLLSGAFLLTSSISADIVEVKLSFYCYFFFTISAQFLVPDI